MELRPEVPLNSGYVWAGKRVNRQRDRQAADEGAKPGLRQRIHIFVIFGKGGQPQDYWMSRSVF
jgi:hypothetical protein